MVEVVDYSGLGNGSAQAKGTRRDRNLFMGSKVLSVKERDAKLQKLAAASTGDGGDSDSDEEIKMEVSDTLRRIGQMAASTLSEKGRRKHDKQEAIRLGMRAPKNAKVPVKILQGMRKKQKERDTAHQQTLRDQGMSTKRGLTTEDKLKLKLAENRSKLAWKDKSDVNGDRFSTVGKYRNGILHVDRNHQGKGGKEASKSKTSRISRLHKGPRQGAVGGSSTPAKPSGRVPKGTRR